MVSEPAALKLATTEGTFYVGQNKVTTPGTDTNDVAITAFADYSETVVGTVKVTTSVAYGFSSNDTVLIRDTTNYNGSYTVTRIDATNFYITHAWDDDDATGNVAGTFTTFFQDGAGGWSEELLQTDVDVEHYDNDDVAGLEDIDVNKYSARYVYIDFVHAAVVFVVAQAKGSPAPAMCEGACIWG
ncbi:unnamed protein product [marine sediment metagenome]|uniref:Uncharacterized protein n=1 Tax=marine sediment metagenome TaxID=412755 RepID=X1CVD2_9ZZZZ